MWNLIPKNFKRKKLVKILKYTSEIIDKRGWLQGKSLEYADTSYDPKRCKYCLSAAIGAAVNEMDINLNYGQFTYNVLSNFLSVPVVTYNDRRAQDKFDVLKSLDNAILYFENGGEIEPNFNFEV